MNNAELLRACVDTGAVEEWAEFISRFQPLIAGVIARTVTRVCGAVNAQLVDDLIQETYLRLCRNDCRILREFRTQHEASFFGYLKENGIFSCPGPLSRAKGRAPRTTIGFS